MFSSTGVIILLIGILFTVGLPLTINFKGNKIKNFLLSILVDNYKLLLTKQTTQKNGIILKSIKS